MQLNTPTAPVGTITLSAYDPNGDYLVRRTADLRFDMSEASPVLDPGATLREAIFVAAAAAAASSSPAGTPLGRAYGVVQARQGVLELRPLTFDYDGYTYPAFIDGPKMREWGLQQVSVATKTRDLLAVVGATSYIDLSAEPTGVPRPLPA